MRRRLVFDVPVIYRADGCGWQWLAVLVRIRTVSISLSVMSRHAFGDRTRWLSLGCLCRIPLPFILRMDDSVLRMYMSRCVRFDTLGVRVDDLQCHCYTCYRNAD